MSDEVCLIGNLGPRGIRMRAIAAVFLTVAAVAAVVWVRATGSAPVLRWIAIVPFAVGALCAFQAAGGT